jgi:hypothetical protein
MNALTPEEEEEEEEEEQQLFNNAIHRLVRSVASLDQV